MTLVTAVQGKDFVVVGTDSRGTFGHPNVAYSAYDTMQKLVVLTPHVAVLTYGVGEVGDNILQEVKRDKLQQQVEQIDGISDVLRELQKYCLDKWNQWLKNVPFEARPAIGYIVAGLDKNSESEYSIPKIYSMNSMVGFMPGFHRYGWANGGIPIYAVYLYGRRYKSDMSLDELSGLAAYVISETASQDHRVGGPLKMAQILPKGCESLSEEQIKELLDKYKGGNMC